MDSYATEPTAGTAGTLDKSKINTKVRSVALQRSTVRHAVNEAFAAQPAPSSARFRALGDAQRTVFRLQDERKNRRFLDAN